MGQYWKVVNLDKKQCVHPHELGTGAKLWEQLANPITGQVLVFLLAPLPFRRGGGDLEPHKLLGSWAGDRIVMVGDYSENSDLPSCPVPFGDLYREADDNYEDISAAVRAAVEKALGE